MKSLFKTIKLLILSIFIILTLSIPSFSAQILQYPLFQVIDVDGNPVSGGLLYFYIAGTTTPKNAYSDSALTVAIANPYTLNTKGEYPGLIYLDGIYKITVYESDGVTVVTGFPIDNYEGSGSSILDFASLSDYADFEAAVTSIGATESTLYIDTDSTIADNTIVPTTLDLYFYQGNTLSVDTGKTLTIKGCLDPGAFLKFEGAGTTVLTGNTCTPVVYAEWWGAEIGDSTDDLAAFDSALASIASLTVQALPGTYNLSDTIDIYGTGKHLRGSGRQATIFLADDGVVKTLQLGITGTTCSGCSISDLTVQLDDVSPDATEIGITGWNYVDNRLDNVRITSYYVGLNLRWSDSFGTQSTNFIADNLQVDKIEDTYVWFEDVSQVIIKGSQFGIASESLDADEIFLFDNTATKITIANNIIFPQGTNASTNTSGLHFDTGYSASGTTFNISNNQFRNMAQWIEFDDAETVVLVINGNEFENDGTINGNNLDAAITGNVFGDTLTLTSASTFDDFTFVGNIFTGGSGLVITGVNTLQIAGMANDGAVTSFGQLGQYASTDADHGGAGAAFDFGAQGYEAELDGFISVTAACDANDTATMTLEVPTDGQAIAQDSCGNSQSAFIMGMVRRGIAWEVNKTEETGDPDFYIRWIPLN